MRVLGLSSDARVHISAPGIEVVLTGDPEQVRSLLTVVKNELERSARHHHGRARLPSNEEQIVRPTELDEMDSPYALPEARVLPVGDSQVTDEKIVRLRHAPDEDVGVDDAATLLPEPDTHDEVLTMRPKVSAADSDDRPKPEVVGTKLESDPPDEPDGPEPEVTAVAQNPSGPMAAQSSPLRAALIPDLATVEVHSPPRGTRAPEIPKPEATLADPKPPRAKARNRSGGFVTDGGPTLMPSDSQSEIHRRDSQEEVNEVSDSDIHNL